MNTNNPVSSMLRQNIENFPDKSLFIFPKNNTEWAKFTYKQFSERLTLFSNGIAAKKLRHGTRICVMVPPCIDMFALIFALLENGMVPVLVDPVIGVSNVTKCLDEAKPEVYVGTKLTNILRQVLGWGKNSIQYIFTIDNFSSAVETSPTDYLINTNLNDEAAVVFTSGSTGLPKGAIYTINNFLTQVAILRKSLNLSDNEVDLPAFTLFAMIDCLLGVTAVIPDMHFPPPAKINPYHIIQAIQKHRVSTMFVSPAALNRISQFGEKNKCKMPSLKKVITAGAPAPVDIQEKFLSLLSPDAELLNIYGATEALPITIINSNEIIHETQYLSSIGAGICVGYPVNNINVKIIEIHDKSINIENIHFMPTNEVGEIIISGPAVTKSYAGNDQANLLSKIPLEDGSFFHRTGDLGYIDEKNRLWFCGRKSHRVITRSQTLFTEVVEGVLNVHPYVHRTALVGVKKDDNVIPVIWVEINDGVKINKKQLIKELKQLAEKSLHPISIKKFLFHPSFPTDVRHNSKIIREKLANMAERML